MKLRQGALFLAVSMHLAMPWLPVPAFAMAPASSEGPVPVFWSWYHDDDLRAAPGAVAMLVDRIVVNGETIKHHRRLNKLQTRARAPITAVVRLEVKKLPESGRREEFIESLSKSIINLTFGCGRRVEGLQIDFDAKSNERVFYRQLLKRLKKSMPADTDLSMTALASWVTGDNWLAEDQWLTGENGVSEVVPMFFSMGQGETSSLNALKNCVSLDSPVRLKSIGLSIDEKSAPSILLSKNGFRNFHRVYFFSSRGWNKQNVEQALDYLSRHTKGE